MIGGQVPGLLNDVGQFVRQQAAPVVGVRRETAGSEEHVPAGGEGLGIDGAC